MNLQLKDFSTINNNPMEQYKKLNKSQLIEKLLKLNEHNKSLEDRLTKLENIISPQDKPKKEKKKPVIITPKTTPISRT